MHSLLNEVDRRNLLARIEKLAPNKSEPGVWREDTRDLKDLVRRAAQKRVDEKTKWPDHPAFGSITGEAWGVLAYRHTDHHLKQFGL